MKETWRHIQCESEKFCFRYVLYPAAMLLTGLYAANDDDFSIEMIDSMTVAAMDGRLSRLAVMRLFLLSGDKRRMGFKGIWNGLDFYHRAHNLPEEKES